MEANKDFTHGAAIELAPADVNKILANLELDGTDRDQAQAHLLSLNDAIIAKGNINDVFAEVSAAPLKEKLLQSRLLAQMHRIARVR